MCINNLTISLQGSFRQAKTDSHLNKKDVAEKRRQVDLMQTKIGKGMCLFLEKILEEYKFTPSAIRILAAAIIIDMRSKNESSHLHRFRNKFAVYRSYKCRYAGSKDTIQYNILALPRKYIAASASCSTKTVSRSLKPIRESGVLTSFRRHLKFKRDTYGTNHFVINYNLLLKKAFEKFSKNCLAIDDIFPYLSQEDFKCMQILANSSITEPVSSVQLSKYTAKHKECPITYYYYLDKEKEENVYQRQMREIRERSDSLFTRAIAVATKKFGENQGNFLTKKAFETVCDSLGIGEEVTGSIRIHCIEDTFTFVGKGRCSDSTGLKLANEVVEKVTGLILPHLYRISNFIGWCGRVNISTESIAFFT